MDPAIKKSQKTAGPEGTEGFSGLPGSRAHVTRARERCNTKYGSVPSEPAENRVSWFLRPDHPEWVRAGALAWLETGDPLHLCLDLDRAQHCLAVRNHHLCEAWRVTATDSRDEFEAALCNIIDRLVARFPDQFQPGELFKGLLTAPLWNDDVINRVAKTTPLPHKIFDAMTTSNGQVLSYELYAFMFREPIKELIKILVARMDYPDHAAGPPVAERRKMIAALDREIENLQQRETEMIADAQAAGLKINNPVPRVR